MHIEIPLLLELKRLQLLNMIVEPYINGVCVESALVPQPSTQSSFINHNSLENQLVDALLSQEGLALGRTLTAPCPLLLEQNTAYLIVIILLPLPKLSRI